MDIEFGDSVGNVIGCIGFGDSKYWEISKAETFESRGYQQWRIGFIDTMADLAVFNL